MTMKEIIDPTDTSKIYDRVFTARESFDIYFVPQIKKRGILSPTAPTLDNRYSQAFLKAAISTGDDAFFVSLTERPETTICDWLVSLDSNSVAEFIERQELYYALEHAIYSSNGKWGIRFTSDFYALIGGPESFISTFYSEIGASIDEMVLNYMKGVQNKKSIPKRLINLFGIEEAERYLQMYKDSL